MTPTPWTRDWPATRVIDSGRTYFVLEQSDFDRACACVNAMVRVSKPAEFVNRGSMLAQRILRDHHGGGCGCEQCELAKSCLLSLGTPAGSECPAGDAVSEGGAP